MKVCAVTCTGGRPELFALCRRWVMGQSARPDVWIVTTDDGSVPSGLPSFATHVALPSAGVDGALRSALSAVPDGHAAVVMEDDDYYSPEHIHKCVAALRDADVATACMAVRWHLPAQRWAPPHAQGPLIQGVTAIHPDRISDYREVIGRWGDAVKDNLFREKRYGGWTSVGIKGVGYGLPGRPGFTNAHKPDHPKVLGLQRDPGLVMFRKFLGTDADAYISLLQ